jgi:hypothetical protein
VLGGHRAKRGIRPGSVGGAYQRARRGATWSDECHEELQKGKRPVWQYG